VPFPGLFAPANLPGTRGPSGAQETGAGCANAIQQRTKLHLREPAAGQRIIKYHERGFI
jgi:hypothetical protein